MPNPYAQLQMPDFAGTVRQGFEHGSNMANMARQREAQLAAAQAMGGDSNALMKLYALDPGMASGIEEQLHQRGERQREGDYRGALGDHMLGGGSAPASPNALAALQGGSVNALMQYAPGNQTHNRNGAGMGGLTARTAGGYATPGIGDGIPGNPPAASVGPRPDAMARAIRANPEGFLKFQGQQTQLTQDKLKLAIDINDFGMQLLGGVHDQATYDMAKRRAAQVYQQHGIPFPELPEQYSADAIRGLQMQGMDTSKQLAAIVRENRLDWDIQDDIADNESLDRYRQGQIDNTRRGQDVRSRDQRRGQDRTDRRVRGSASYQGRGGKSAKPRAVAANGQPITVKGGKWVYEKTGQPVQ